MKKVAQIVLSLGVLLGASALSACGGADYSNASYGSPVMQNGYGSSNNDVHAMGNQNYNNQNDRNMMMRNDRDNSDRNMNQNTSNQGGWFSGSRDQNQPASNQGGWFSGSKDQNQPASNQGGWFSGSRDQNQPASNQGGWFSGSRDNTSAVRDTQDTRGNSGYMNARDTQDSDNQSMNQPASNQGGWFSNARDNNTSLNREELATRVRSALENNRNLQGAARNIQVTTDNDGTITLRGFVITTSDKDNAESAAKNVSGVKNVDNKLSVQNQNAPANQ